MQAILENWPIVAAVLTMAFMWGGQQVQIRNIIEIQRRQEEMLQRILMSRGDWK
jgi:hypothetical protein